MKVLVHSIVKVLVDYSDQISIAERHSLNTTIVELTVAKQDRGKVIGKEGRTINAIRTILKASVARKKRRVILELVG